MNEDLSFLLQMCEYASKTVMNIVAGGIKSIWSS